MPERDQDTYINQRPDKNDDEAVDEEVKESFAEDQTLDYGSQKLQRDMNAHTGENPELSGGDVDADWRRADSVGEESVGGSVPTPDQDVVDEIGEATGVSYSDTEPLHTADKLDKRDKDRWELDPASSPDYQERVREEFKEPAKQKPKSKKKK